MSRQYPDLLRRVFPIQQLFRGQSLWALVWCVIGMAAFAAVLVCAFLIVALLNSRGVVTIESRDVAEYQQLFASGTDTSGTDAENENADENENATQQPTPRAIPGLGLKAVAWELRHRSWGQVLAWSCQRFTSLRATDSALNWLLVVGLALGFVYSTAMTQMVTLASRAAGHTAGQLRHSLHRHSIRMGTSDLVDARTAEVIELFTAEVETVRSGIEKWIRTIFRCPLGLLVLLSLAMTLNWMVTIECLLPLLACWYLIRRERRYLEREQTLNRDRASIDLKLLGEGIRKSRLIRGYQLEANEDQRFEKHLERYQGRLQEIERRERRTFWLSGMLGLVCFSLVLFLLGARMQGLPGSPEHLTLAEGLLLLSCFAFGLKPVESLANLRQIRSEAGQAAERIYRYLNTIPEVGQAVGAKFLQPLEKMIELEDVVYRLGKRNLLNKVSLKIPATGTTAIVAFDALEARALISLLPRFIEPHAGRVLIDGEDINWATLESLRAETLLVGGKEPWYTGTILENITGGEARYSLNQATEAAKMVHAHNFIQKFPQGYETIIGEHGEQLRGVQGFLLALARAMLRDPVLLIIEEPSLEMTDAEKAHVEDAIRRASSGRTTIILPSRISTLRGVDRIVLLNRGKVEVVGTHDVLLKNSALYRHWEYMNFNEFRHETSPIQ
ncbi:MAG: ABC transporter ATP-binding protein [Rhodopirellula sp.]|nr:ABC transporter ATP-binding protein [Rhodopirellula sp.]